MLRKTFFLFMGLVLLVGMMGLGGQPAAAQQLQTNPPPDPSGPASGFAPGSSSRGLPGSSWWQTPEGDWYVSMQPGQRAAALSPQSTGGPDNYGYTWDDSAALAWIDATGSDDTGLSGSSYNKAVGPISLPFTFNYYENAYNSVWIAASGYLAFKDNAGNWPWQSDIPDPTSPNNIIAPYWSPFNLAGSGKTSRVFYKTGGTAPNRYFVVEWNKVAGTETGNTYTFEVILSENGNITFQYKTMSYSSNGYSCGSAGIEDSTGLDGLNYVGFCESQASNKAVLFTHPAPSARISLSPAADGGFISPGGVRKFDLAMRNTGNLGADIYDLFPSSTWPMSLYSADGVTALTDTNGNGTLDSGPIPQGASKNIVIQINAPVTARVGQSDDAQVLVRSWINTAKSRTFSLKVAVPDRFAQSFLLSGTPSTGFYRPNAEVSGQTTLDSGYTPVVATTPDGNVVQVWSEFRRNSNARSVDEIFYAVLNSQGNILRSPVRLTDHSGSTLTVYDDNPAVIVSANGSVGVIWIQRQYRSSDGASNYNVYYMVLDSAGGVVVPAANLTNDTQWYTGDVNSVRFYGATIAATPDNHFALAWEKEIYTGSDWLDTIWYSVYNASGGIVKAITQFGSDTCSYYPSLSSLIDGSVFLTAASCGSISMGRLDSAGNILTGPTTLSDMSGADYPDAVQLNNGHILLAWTNYNAYKSYIQYAMLDTNLNVLGNVTDLTTSSLSGDGYVSVTHFGNRGVLTWGNDCCSYQPNLYYALVDGNGNVLTPPMIFVSDFVNYSIRLPYNGQGNTFLAGANDITPPTSSAHSPASSNGTFSVTWNGSDTDLGIASYNVWVRDGAAGVWTKWQSDTTANSAAYSGGVPGHTYYFRSQATDNADNVETDLPVDGDTHTTLATYTVSGHVLNLRGKPVFNATVSAPGALNTAVSDGFGGYALYFSAANSYNLTAGADGYGTLPLLKSLSVTANLSNVDFVLPPEQDAVTNGGWESGDLTGWQKSASVTPLFGSASAHTGVSGIQLNAAADGPEFTSYITQTITVPNTGIQPTLSWMYRVASGSPSGAYVVEIKGASQTVTKTVDLTTGGWTHAWIDLSSFKGQTVTLRFGYQGALGTEQIYLDEISIGENHTGSYQAFLPLSLK